MDTANDLALCHGLEVVANRRIALAGFPAESSGDMQHPLPSTDTGYVLTILPR